MLETYRVGDLEQVRLLADPLKLRLIQVFAEGPRTVSDVAQELGENVTRLYRHVDALLDAGLVEIVREEKKRGAVERTFRAVARRFEVEQSLFTAGAGGHEAIIELLRAGEEELLGALSSASGENKPLVTRLRFRASPERLAALRGALEEWLATAQAIDDDEGGEEAPTEEAGALIAFYRIPR